MKLFSKLLLAALAFCSLDAVAQLRICSQNLARLGEERPQEGPWTKVSKSDYLLQRILEARCDVVALQEVFGGTRERGERNLNRFARDLARITGRPVWSAVGESENDPIRNGFLVHTDRLQVREVLSLFGGYLPKLSPLSPGRKATRGALAVVLAAPQGTIVIVNHHFKSRAGGWKDPSGTEFETLRMESAEELRDWALRQAERFGHDTLLFIVGDRNSEPASASADILRGARMLADFRRGCRVGPELETECAALAPRPPQLEGLFRLRAARHPQFRSEGSFRLRSRQLLIDEIHVRPRDLERFERVDGNLAIGFTGRFGYGSDHKLLWAELARGR